jgi:hypothetical protein
MDPSVINSQLSGLKKRVALARTSGEPKDKAESVDTSPVEESSTNQKVKALSTVCGQDRAIKVTGPADSAAAPPAPTRAEIAPSHMKDGTGAPRKAVPIIRWVCRECSNECIPVMRESHCLCGHRMKEHKAGTKKNGEIVFPCSANNCKCAHFFYLVAEGAWILRCRCKHKHTDHDCAPGPHACSKCKECASFDSPWVCNCGHAWGAHEQRTVVMTDERIDEEVSKAGAGQKKIHYYRNDGIPSEAP